MWYPWTVDRLSFFLIGYRKFATRTSLIRILFSHLLLFLEKNDKLFQLFFFKSKQDFFFTNIKKNKKKKWFLLQTFSHLTFHLLSVSFSLCAERQLSCQRNVSWSTSCVKFLFFSPLLLWYRSTGPFLAQLTVLCCLFINTLIQFLMLLCSLWCAFFLWPSGLWLTKKQFFCPTSRLSDFSFLNLFMQLFILYSFIYLFIQ